MKGAWTYCNQRGGNVFYKALAHPACAESLAALRASPAAIRHLVVFDPCDHCLTAGAFLDHLFGF